MAVPFESSPDRDKMNSHSLNSHSLNSHSLNSHSLNSRSLPWPVEWGALFGAPRPLIVEIGFGRGAFLHHLAVTYPDHNIIGLEIANQCMQNGERLIAREGLYNVRVIHSTAETALVHLFEPGSIQQIHINFPDPWFKSDHHRRRLMQPDTVALLVDRLAHGGELYLATDITEYAELTHALLSAAAGLVNILPTAWADSMPGRVVTKYEATARREGRTCYYFAYRRSDAPSVPLPVGKEWDMPHAVIHTPLTLGAMADAFAPIQLAVDDIHVHIMAAFVGRVGVLFEAHIGDPTIRQHVMIALYPYGVGSTPDTYTLHMTPIGQPRATRGTHIAVRALRDWALTLHPDARLLHEKLLDT